MNSQSTQNASLFIGGLKPSVTRNDMITHFSKYGDVKNVNMGKLPAGLHNRGFAFIRFCNVSSTDRVLADKQLIMGREVECRLSYGKKFNQLDMEINSKKKLYVSELSPNDQNEDLELYFSKFGKIDQSYIIYYPNTSISKCFGYVEFKNEKSASKALNGNHQTWKITNFKSYKELKDNKPIFCGKSPKVECSTKDNSFKCDTNSSDSINNIYFFIGPEICYPYN